MYIEKSICGGWLFVGSGLLKINECVGNTAKNKSLSIHQDHKSIKKYTDISVDWKYTFLALLTTPPFPPIWPQLMLWYLSTYWLCVLWHRQWAMSPPEVYSNPTRRVSQHHTNRKSCMLTPPPFSSSFLMVSFPRLSCDLWCDHWENRHYMKLEVRHLKGCFRENSVIKVTSTNCSHMLDEEKNILSVGTESVFLPVTVVVS